jgi:hypothetical protein
MCSPCRVMLPILVAKRMDTSKLGLPYGARGLQYVWIVQGVNGVILCNDRGQYIAAMQGARCTVPVHVVCATTGVLRWVEHEVTDERIRAACLHGSAVDVIDCLPLDGRAFLPRLRKLASEVERVGAWNSYVSQPRARQRYVLEQAHLALPASALADEVRVHAHVSSHTALLQ